MSERPKDHTARQVWQPRAVARPAPDADGRPETVAETEGPHTDAPHTDESGRPANVRVLTPAQDPATAALSRDLVTIAERALDDRLEAEQIVAGLCRLQAALLTTATQSAMPSQREAARAELERLVRRAALDALPPVIGKPSTAPGKPASSTAAPPARKLAEPGSGKPAGRATRPAPAPPSPPIAAAPSRPSEPEPAPGPAPGTPHRRPAGQPTGLADLPSIADLPGATRPRAAANAPRGPITAARGTVTAVEAKPQHRGRKLALTAVALTVMLGGLGFGYLAYAPEDPIDPDLARLPALPPQAAAPAVPPAEPEPAPTADLSPDPLQLEAAEPAAGPLRTNAAPASPPPPQPVAAIDPDLRLVLLYQGNGTGAARADDLQATLAALKDPPAIERRSVDFSIATPRIRYFYAADASAAAALADLLGPPGNGTWQVQDFTHLRPGPTQGTLEVFIPTTSG